ncbi:DsbA family oxidoreductase [Streptomyces sp. AV19]|uniref:DsbA family oxidoreductase n=1 Tax=Streptomyces sp. AV19 TaxID=2793068 RepID=UPI0018FEB11A|nr:DsbA family oxidoreductase [Streptomyces sp. AV19]MBH1937740.1 DsbA family oxidoreductase [Streptomyces sp. AV19]MDG4536408.1 DsbA family oxidoreductase [Streptomyces sp. AV19]
MTEKNMKVRIVLDIACAWSALGYARFKHAVERFRAEGGAVDVEFLPFQIVPDAPAEGELLSEVHRRVFGPSAEEQTARMTALAARSGLELNFDKAIFTNTLDAHRLIAHAAAQDRGEQMAHRLFSAYFTEGLNVADPSVLERLARETGVEQAPLAGSAEVAAGQRVVRDLGVTSVPVFLFEGGGSLVGARSEEDLLAALREAAVGAPARVHAAT